MLKMILVYVEYENKIYNEKVNLKNVSLFRDLWEEILR